MLNTNTKDVSDFINISLSIMRKSYLKSIHELPSTRLCDTDPNFLSFTYQYQAIDLIESKTYKPFPHKS